MIDSREASEALADIDDMVSRVRQSRIYDLASQMMVMWGLLVFAGYLVTYFVPRYMPSSAGLPSMPSASRDGPGSALPIGSDRASARSA
jgi:hypothetical protein